jgi:hypothetical protein
MASVVLTGDTSGTLTVSSPAIAGSNTQTLVATTGTLAPIVSGTAVSATGTSVDFTGIPSWVKRITVMFSGVSTNSTGNFQIQLGAGSVTTSGYSCRVTYFNSTVLSGANVTTGIAIANYGAANLSTGSIVFTLFTANTWVANGYFADSAANASSTGGALALGGTLDRVRITTINGTDTFDAGSINILYE